MPYYSENRTQDNSFACLSRTVLSSRSPIPHPAMVDIATVLLTEIAPFLCRGDLRRAQPRCCLLFTMRFFVIDQLLLSIFRCEQMVNWGWSLLRTFASRSTVARNIQSLTWSFRLNPQRKLDCSETPFATSRSALPRVCGVTVATRARGICILAESTTSCHEPHEVACRSMPLLYTLQRVGKNVSIERQGPDEKRCRTLKLAIASKHCAAFHWGSRRSSKLPPRGPRLSQMLIPLFLFSLFFLQQHGQRSTSPEDGSPLSMSLGSSKEAEDYVFVTKALLGEFTGVERRCRFCHCCLFLVWWSPVRNADHVVLYFFRFWGGWQVLRWSKLS